MKACLSFLGKFEMMKMKKWLHKEREGKVLISKSGKRKFKNVDVNSAILRIINRKGLLKEASIKYILFIKW